MTGVSKQKSLFPKSSQHDGNGWAKVPLGKLCRLVNGKAFTPSDWTESGLPIIRIQNLNDVTKSFNYWAGSPERQVMVNSGDVLLGWSGTPGTSFGAHVWDREPGVLNQHIFRVDLDGTRIAKEWAVPAINHQLEFLIGKAHGGVGLRHVKKAEVESLLIPLPSLTEQKRIAGILKEQLATVDRARAAAETQLNAAKALPAAYLREVFEGAESRNWKRCRLGDLLDRHNEIIHPGDRSDGEAVFVGLEHIEPNTGRRIGSAKINLAHLSGRKPTFRKGQIVYGYLRPYLNKVWLADFDGCSSVDQFAFEVHRNRVDPGFVAAFMRSDTFLRRSAVVTTTGQLPRISIDEILAVDVDLPSKNEEQSRIMAALSARLDATDSMMANCRSRATNIDAMPAALLRSAFQGRL